MREILLIVHILSAAAWIGGALFALTSFSALANRGGLSQIADVDEAVGSKYFGASVVLLLLSGVALVLTSDAFGWGDAFVLIGIGIVVVDGALEGTFFGPRMKASYEAEDLSSFRRLVKLSTIYNATLFVVAVWAMVTKIGV